jgi:hypothetical protein
MAAFEINTLPNEKNSIDSAASNWPSWASDIQESFMDKTRLKPRATSYSWHGLLPKKNMPRAIQC